MSYCGECGRELPANAAFCGRCGSPVQSHPTGGVASSLPTPSPAPPTPPDATQVIEPRPTPQPSAPAPPATSTSSELPVPPEDSRAVSDEPAPTADAPAAAPVAPPAAPDLPAPLRGPQVQVQVDAGSVQASLRDGALVAAGLYAASVVIAAVALTIIGSATVGDWFRVGGWAQGMTFRGSLDSSGSTGGSGFSLGGALHATAQPGLLLVACLASAALLAVRSERYQPSANLASALIRSALAGGGAAAVSVAVALITRGDVGSASADGSSSSFSAGIGVPSVLVGALVFVTLASAAGRTAVGWHRLVPARWQQEAVPWLPAARGVAEFAVVGIGLALVAEVITGLASGAPYGAWLAALADLPLDQAALVAFGAGAVISSGATSGFGGADTTVGTFVGSAPGWAWLLLLIPLAAAAAAGARTVLRRPPSAKVPMASSWHFSVLLLAGALVVTFLSSMTASGNISFFSGEAHLGLGWGSVILAALVWGTLIPVVGFYVVRLLMGASPHLLVRLATVGRGQLNGQWAAALGQPESGSSPRPANVGWPGQVPAPTPGPDDWTAGPSVPGPTPSSQPPQPPRPLSPATKRVLAVAAIVVVVLLAGLVGVKIVNATVFTPAAQASTYLHDLARGDAVGALQTGPPIAGPTLTDAALRVQEAQAPMTNISTGAATVVGAQTSVAVSYDLGGRPVHTTLTLVREGSTYGVFDHWKLTQTTAQVSVAAPGGGAAATLNGAGISGQSGTVPLNVLPGALVFGSAGSSAASAYETVTPSQGSTTVAESPGAQIGVQLEQTLTPAGNAAVLAAVDQSFTACTAQAVLEPTGCPVRAYVFYPSVTGVKWTVVTPPSKGGAQVSLNADGTVAVSGSFDAKVSYSYIDTSTGASVPKTDDGGGSYNATVTLTGSAPSVTWQ
jgi:hypothetical protein